MSVVVIVALEGVLQSPGGRPIEAGCRMYRNLRMDLIHHIGVISAAENDPARRFFDHQHMPAPTFLLSGTPGDEFEWVAMCNRTRREYPYDIDYIITPDPAVASALYFEGFRTLLWTDPRYGRPEWRPDAKPHEASSWAKLSGTIRHDKELIASDERLG